MSSCARTSARASQGAFLSWAKQAAIPMPASPEEPMSDEALAAIGRLLEGKRFVFLGEPDHYLIEKFPYRLTFIQHLFGRGWRHVGFECGRSMGWRLDQYIETADTSFLPGSRVEDGYDYRRAFGHMIDFVERHESAFYKQLHELSESRPEGEPRLRFFGFDFDLGDPLAAVEPIQALLTGHEHDDHIREVLEALKHSEVTRRSTQVEVIQKNLAKQEEGFIKLLGENLFHQVESWLRTLRFSVAAVNRPRQAQNQSGHRLWRAEREKMMMEHMDETIAVHAPEDKFILLGHDGHLSKDASNLYNRPQRSTFWGYRSWFRALGYAINEKVTCRPLDTYGGSVGSHIHDRFPGQVLSIWMLYGQGQLMGRDGPIDVRLHGDTVESLLAQVGDRFLLPLESADSGARDVLSRANFRWAGGYYASADLAAQADAIFFVKDVSAVRD